MPITARPEVLPPDPPRGPVGTARELFSDERLDALSHLLDDFIRIPGTPLRFGLDGILGLIPGIGDLAGGLASSIIIIAAWVRGVPRVVVARMVLNVAIETAVGAVPWLGNLFDIAWRANRRNYHLLTGTLEKQERHTTASWLFLSAVCLVLVVLMVLPMLFALWLLTHIGAWLGAAPSLRGS